MSARGILTYDDYAALPDDGRRYELHEGELVMTPSPRTRHGLPGVGNGREACHAHHDHPGPKASAYSRCACPEPGALCALLGRALGVRGVVEKRRERRELFMCGRRRIHLDEVRGLGQFLEIEVVLDSSETTADGERVVHELMAALEIPQSALVAGAHPAPASWMLS